MDNRHNKHTQEEIVVNHWIVLLTLDHTMTIFDVPEEKPFKNIVEKGNISFFSHILYHIEDNFNVLRNICRLHMLSI